MAPLKPDWDKSLSDIWDGQDRRKCPESKELTEHFEKQVKAFYERIGERLDTQKKELDAQYSKLQDALDLHEKRMEDLMDTFTAHMTAVNSAFLHDMETGRPDYLGHHLDHKARKTVRDWIDTQKSKILAKALEYISLAFLAWLGLQMWQRLAAGPEGYIEPSRESPKVMEAPRAAQKDTR